MSSHTYPVTPEAIQELDQRLKGAAERIVHLEGILNRALEMLNVPGTTFGTLPQAINAKLMERDRLMQERLREIDDLQGVNFNLKTQLAAATETLKEHDQKAAETAATHVWVTIKEWGTLHDENRRLKAQLEASERESFKKALLQRHPNICWDSDYAQGAWTAWKLARNLPE